MELGELQSRLEHLRHLESRENGPETPQKAYLTMERDEMIRYIEFLHERLDEEKRARELSDKRFGEESAARKEADKRVLDLLGKIDRMGEQHQEELQKLQKTIEDLTSAVRLNKKNRFATTSQKNRHSSQKDERPTRDEEREDHDGTPASAPSEADAEADVEIEETTEAAPVKEDREYRKGMKYNTMKASRVILHKSDRSQLPDGSVVIRSYTKRAEVSAVYHTFISTCSMLGVSAQKYFKMFFSAIIEGRRDYARSTLSLA